MALHPIEEATIRAFIVPPKHDRYMLFLSNDKKRAKFLGSLNHCHDFNERFATELPPSTDVTGFLHAHGAPETCWVISDCRDIDARELALADAVDRAELAGWGTIICCIPGKLAYYLDEAGSKRRLLLDRPPENQRPMPESHALA